MVETDGFPEPARWTAAPAWAAPVRVPAADAPRHVSGLDVGATAFASPRAGWAFVGSLGTCRLLHTADGGRSWQAQLAWHGMFNGRLTALDRQRGGLDLGVTPGHDRVNGHRVGDGGYAALIATTADAGNTWTVASPPHPRQFAGQWHLLSQRRAWLVNRPPGSYPRCQLARTVDGGTTWATIDGPARYPLTGVAFSSLDDGLAVAVDRFRDDLLYATGDGGAHWRRVSLEPPAGLPASAMTWLAPLIRSGRPGLLVLRTEQRRPTPRRPRWVGSYAYLHTGGHRFAGPYRLPCAGDQPVTLATGPDGRFWVASGQDIWTSPALDGPWEHRPVPLPGTHPRTRPWDPYQGPVPGRPVIRDIAPVGDGVIWLTTTAGGFGGAEPTGQVYRTEDDGVHWIVLTVEAHPRPVIRRAADGVAAPGTSP